VSEERCFTTADIDEFARASHDLNPLHLDDAYAGRTPFGGRVVHGMLGVLAALQPVLATLPLLLRRVEIRFQRPLRTGVPHRVSVASDGPRHLRLTLHRGAAPYLSVDLQHDVASQPFAPAPARPGEAPRQEAVERTAEELIRYHCHGAWTLDSEALIALAERLALRTEHLPPLQLSALLFVSYLVGMEIPGRQALFRSVRIDFAPVPLPPTHVLTFAAETTAVDADSGRVEASATLSCPTGAFATVLTSAYNRPSPVTPDLDAFVRSLAPSAKLRGRVALVTGASGGLGSLLAAGFAAHGADVVVHGRVRLRAENVASFVRGLGPRALVVDGDLDEDGVWARIARDVRRELGRLDIAVHNAGTPPVPVGLDEITPEELERLLLLPIRTLVRGHQALLPLIARQRGWVVGVSSAATQAPPASWWSYVAVKAAGEALLRALAVDHPELRFLEVRPPRLRTDMTALHRLELGIPPERVARTVVAALNDEQPPKNHIVLDRFFEETA